MDRIKNKFKEMEEKGEKALVGFVSAGDPDLPKSLDLIKAMCEAGIDVLELGIPFSDPTSDGPVIQRSSARSLANGATLTKVLDMTKKIRKTTDIPIILFSYYNPIFAYGVENFYIDATLSGADGVLVVDLPPEESDEMTSYWKKNDFSLIRLLAPTTPEERMKKISETGSGFLYLVSKTGVTGSDGLDSSLVSKQMKVVRSVSDLPICVGFGISTPEDVAQIASFADGVVIGSAFERLIEKNMNHPELSSIMAQRVKEYKKATIIT